MRQDTETTRIIITADVLLWDPDITGWTKVGEMLEPTNSHAASPIELNEKLLEICVFI